MHLLTPEQLVRKARGELLLEFPTFGEAIIRLQLAEGESVKQHGGGRAPIHTAATDGQYLFYNPNFITELAAQDGKTHDILGFLELVGLMAHESVHVLFGHYWRFLGRCKTPEQQKRKQIACDLANNPLVEAEINRVDERGNKVNEGLMRLPTGKYRGVYPRDYGLPDFLSAEEYYRLLEKFPDAALGSGCEACGCQGVIDASGSPGEDDGEAEGGEDGDGKPEPVIGRPLRSGDLSQIETEWRGRVESALEAGRQAGSLPAGMDVLIGELAKPSVRWEDVCHRFAREVSQDDYNRFPPNRKLYAYAGLALPKLKAQENMGVFVVFGDMSGSTSVGRVREAFYSEIVGIAEELRPRELHCIGFDTIPQSHVIFTPTEGYPQTAGEMGFKGNGGTDFRGLFDYLKEQEIEPACVVVLTDMEGCGWPEEPPYPVLWAAALSDTVAPWGETVRVEV